MSYKTSNLSQKTFYCIKPVEILRMCKASITFNSPKTAIGHHSLATHIEHSIAKNNVSKNLKRFSITTITNFSMINKNLIIYLFKIDRMKLFMKLFINDKDFIVETLYVFEVLCSKRQNWFS